jgi:prevent-host-death family protein
MPHNLVYFLIMIRLNIHEAKTHLSRYLERVARGETVLLCKRNVPVAEIRPLPAERTRPRSIGLAKGEFQVPAEFFLPLPDDLQAAFEGRNP